jgi:(4-(4-[2-(gamma-L-glutamylamino)ethyl]phenoxymethyl)furan-2-yl)methanamine synthase
MVNTLGLDVGGANLKAADCDGAARLQPFELWKNPAGLKDALRSLLGCMPAFDRLAVTMTGELCDCFPTRREGVLAILDAVEAAAEGRPVRVWLADGRLGKLARARHNPLRAAAVNWLALATFAGRCAPQGPAMLIDVGSTTTDLAPLQDGRPLPFGRTDAERLESGALMYAGVRRTPLCAYFGTSRAAELFATTLDAYLLLDRIPEDPADRRTADGRPATRAAAHARLARMLCADAETCTLARAMELAQEVLFKQVVQLTLAINELAKKMPSPPRRLILAGSGEFLTRVAIQQTALPLDFPPGELVSLAGNLTPEVSQAACAYALAVLATERAHEWK